MSVTINALAQYEFIKDLDGDGKKDTVYMENSRIVCRLSSRQFVKMQSRKIDILNDMSGITDARNGFIFFNDWMRAGYKCQFRYNKRKKQMQLIGMSNYAFGNAANDGSGESSVNLLTNKYIGNWNFYDHECDTLVKIPEISTQLFIPETYLEDFCEDVYFYYDTECTKLYYKYKQISNSKKNCNPISTNQKITRIECSDTINLIFETISEREYTDYKLKSLGNGMHNNESMIDDSRYFTLTTPNNCYEFRSNGYNENYQYLGHIHSIDCHVYYAYGLDAGFLYLLNDYTDEILALLSTFDSGVTGMISSADERTMVYYSSSERQKYSEYYSHRAEITICDVMKDGETKRIKSPQIFTTKDWSIEEISWIDNSTIALKVYNEVDWDKPIYQEKTFMYLKTKIQ